MQLPKIIYNLLFAVLIYFKYITVTVQFYKYNFVLRYTKCFGYKYRLRKIFTGLMIKFFIFIYVLNFNSLPHNYIIQI